MIQRRAFVLTVILLSLLADSGAFTQTEAPAIGAAADLSFAVEEFAARFEDETGMEVRLSLGLIA